MNVEFYNDPDTQLPHCLQHNVTPREAIEVLSRPLERSRSDRGAFIVIGQTQAGRYLKVVCRQLSDAVRIITAYDLSGNSKKAFRRRRRK